MRPDLGGSEDQRAVHVSDDVARFFNLLQRLADEDRRGGALPFRISRREVGPDVSGGDGAQQRVGQSVQQYVAIGVPGQTSVVWNQHPADLQWDAGLEFVRIPAKANAWCAKYL